MLELVQRFAQKQDVSIFTAANALIALIDRGLIRPSHGTPEDAKADLRKIAEQYRPARLH